MCSHWQNVICLVRLKSIQHCFCVIFIPHHLEPLKVIVAVVDVSHGDELLWRISSKSTVYPAKHLCAHVNWDSSDGLMVREKRIHTIKHDQHQVICEVYCIPTTFLEVSLDGDVTCVVCICSNIRKPRAPKVSIVTGSLDDGWCLIMIHDVIIAYWWENGDTGKCCLDHAHHLVDRLKLGSPRWRYSYLFSISRHTVSAEVSWDKNRVDWDSWSWLLGLHVVQQQLEKSDACLITRQGDLSGCWNIQVDVIHHE